MQPDAQQHNAVSFLIATHVATAAIHRRLTAVFKNTLTV